MLRKLGVVGQRRWRLPVAGTVAAVLGVVALLYVGSLPGGSAEVVGGNLPVDATPARNPLDASARNSPAITVNPTDPANLVLASRVDLPSFACALFVSGDGGQSWAPVEVIAPPGEHSVPCFGPDVAFGPDGTLYLSYTSFASPSGGPRASPDAVWLATSSDGGRTISAPTRVAGELAFQLRIGVDPAIPGRLYLAWTQARATGAWGFSEPGNPIVMSTSQDGGRTWSAPAALSPAGRQRVVAPAPVVTASGTVHVAYLDVGGDVLDYHGGHEGRGGEPHQGPWSLVVASSGDHATTWRESTVASDLVPTQRFLQLFPPAPSLAAGSLDSPLYVAFHDGRRGSADVALWVSKDEGRSWGRRVDVGGGVHGDQYLPAVDVAPGGRLDVIYYDRGADTANVMNAVSLHSSSDGGRSFIGPTRLTDRSFDSRIGFGAERQMTDLGSRLGLVSTDAGALAVWADTRAGKTGTGKQNLSRAVVRISEPPHWKSWATWLSGAVVVVGAVLVICGGRFRCRSRRLAPEHARDNYSRG